MPIQVQRDEKLIARLRAAAASAGHVQQDIEGLRRLNKPYVVLHGENVVGAGSSPEIAWAQVSSKIPRAECVLVHIPRADETYFF